MWVQFCCRNAQYTKPPVPTPVINNTLLHLPKQFIWENESPQKFRATLQTEYTQRMINEFADDTVPSENVITSLDILYAAVIRVVTQCSSPTNGCSLELCIHFALLLRTNNMHVTISSCTNHISRYICRQRSRFPRNGSLLLIGQFKERNAELE